jgi:hypothetical protein
MRETEGMRDPLRLRLARWGLLWGLVIAGMTGGQASAPTAQPGQLLVKFAAGASSQATVTAHKTIGSQVVKNFGSMGWQLVQLPAGMSVQAGTTAYKRLAKVAGVEPNYRWRAFATATALPNDPRVSELWGMQRINAPAAWNLTQGSSAVVAIIDSGVDYTHPDLTANMWRNPGEIPGNGLDDDGNGYSDDIFGIDAVNGDTDPQDDDGHGTHVAGTIGAVGNNGLGVAGVNWAVQILALKFLDAEGFGSTDGALACYQYLIAMRARGINIVAVNNSWGGGGESQALQEAIDAAGAAGVVSLCAAGNAASDIDASPTLPASLPCASIIAVAASDENDQRASFSNWGRTMVDLAAPGVNILSTTGGDYQRFNGTSMATPHVTGAVALMLAQRPSLSVAQVKAILLQSVDVLPQWQGLVVSNGRLNLARALQGVQLSIDTVLVDDTVGNGNRSGFIDPGEVICLQIQVHNDQGSALTGMTGTLTCETTGVTIGTGTAAYPDLAIDGLALNSLPFVFVPASDIPWNTPLRFTLRLSTAQGGYSEQFTLLIGQHLPQSVFHDDLEAGAQGWTHTGAGDSWQLVTTTWAKSPTKAWHAQAPPLVADQSLVSPPIALPPTLGNLHLTFWHTYTFENQFDGGVLEISTDDGATFTDLGAEIREGGYTHTLYTTGNPLSGRRAWTGGILGTMTAVIANLQPWAGMTVRLRWRLGTDSSVEREGWYVDAINVSGDEIRTTPVTRDALPRTPFDPSPPDGAEAISTRTHLYWNGARPPVAPNRISTTRVKAQQASVLTSQLPAALTSVAIFQDNNPWGQDINQRILTAHGISYVILPSTEMGIADLSRYDKVIIASVQGTATFYDRLMTHRAYFEAYVDAGGLLDLHLASFIDADAAGRTLPGGLVLVPQTATEVIGIAESAHPVLTTPNLIDLADLQGWNNSAHSYFVTLPPDTTTILTAPTLNNTPVAVTIARGAGRIFATTQPLEWTNASPSYLENTLLFELPEPSLPVVYDVYFDTTNPPLTKIADGISTTECAPDQLAEGVQYYWQVVARSMAGQSAGPVWTFATERLNRLVRVQSTLGAIASPVRVPILFEAQGNENALGCSLAFDPTLLRTPTVSLSADAATATLVVNTADIAAGKLGIVLALPTGHVFPAGTRDLVEVTFTAAVVASRTETTLHFTDSPVQLEVADIQANPLSVQWQDGQVILQVGLEADVAPRHEGDGRVSAIDGVQISRFVAKLDTPATPWEFMRADCAPRATKGDGRLSAIDWVQAGRYILGLDSQQPTGGPYRMAVQARATTLPPAGNRAVRVLDTTLRAGQSGDVAVVLEAQGNECSLAFSLHFDPRVLTFQSAVLGTGAANATVSLNTALAAQGQVGVLLGYLPPTTFAAGTRQVLRLTFLAGTGTGTTALTFADVPTSCEISTAFAAPLGATYCPGIVTVLLPQANHAPVAQGDTISLWADQSVSLAAPGVLANDTDSDGDPLTAVPVTAAAHGIVLLTADGAVTYTPVSGFSGIDTFTYQVSDGLATSAVVTVTLEVTAPLSVVTLAASPPARLPSGRPVTLVARATGGRHVEYHFRAGYRSGSGWVWTTIRPYDVERTCTWIPTETRLWSLIVWAREVGSPRLVEVYGTHALTVTPVLTAVNLSSPNRRTLQPQQQPLLLTALAVGGAQVEYQFRAGYLSGTHYVWTLLRPYTPDRSVTWTPPEARIWLIEVWARETGSVQPYDVSATASYRISP